MFNFNNLRRTDREWEWRGPFASWTNPENIRNHSYSCDICERTFTTLQTLKNHIEVKHNGVKYKDTR